MSTFNGQIEEIPLISVDHFENSNQQCYFLSHCHSDHMRGLSSLATNGAPLYTTQLSSLIIKKKYPHLNVLELELGYPKHIEVLYDNKIIKFIVTALSAGHCLGACMLLFQTENNDILYTGDFRMSLRELKNIKLLNEIREYERVILYLDSSFMKDSYQHFPTQKESLTQIIEIAENFLLNSSNSRGMIAECNNCIFHNLFSLPVILQTSARYGYERLFIELCKKLNLKIFIHEEEVYEFYCQISELHRCFTRDKSTAKVLLIPSYITNKSTEIDSNALVINISALYWSNWDDSKPFHHEVKKNYLRVCYATHNSKSELEDFLDYMRPLKVNLNVASRNSVENNKMLEDVQSYCTHSDESSKVVNSKKFSFKKLGGNKK
jgi:DNA cross-link repair 1C protein